MDDHEVRRRIRRAIDPGPGFPAPMLWERAVSRLNEPPWPQRGPRQVAALAAVVLAVLVVVGTLLVSRSALSQDLMPVAPGWPAAHPPQPSSTRAGAADYQFVSATDGWLVEYEGAGAARVLRTSDGGAHWARAGVLTGVAPSTEFGFFDGRRGVMVGPSPAASNPGFRVFSTTDGGGHWQVVDGAGAAGTMRSASFVSVTEGWLLTGPPSNDSLSVYHTADGGRHWELRSDPSTDQALAGVTSRGGIEFATGQDGWLGAAGIDGRPFLLATGDGGRSWRAVTLPAPPGVDVTGKLLAGSLPRLFGADGLLTAGLSVPQPGRSDPTASTWLPDATTTTYAYETHDGGRTWSFTRQLDRSGIHFEDATHWFRVDSLGGVARSDDAGRTWSASIPLPEPAGWTYRHPSFAGTTGWVLLAGDTRRYAVLRTTDGGAHWTEGELPPP